MILSSGNKMTPGDRVQNGFLGCDLGSRTRHLAQESPALVLKFLLISEQGAVFAFAATSQVLRGHCDLVQGQEPHRALWTTEEGAGKGWEEVGKRDSSSCAQGGRRQEEGLGLSLIITGTGLSCWLFLEPNPAPT